jgi:hypothetical protein
MAFECLLHHSSLDAFSPPVDQTYLAESRFVCSPHVLLDHRCDIPGLERVEIDGAFDRNVVGHVTHSSPES